MSNTQPQHFTPFETIPSSTIGTKMGRGIQWTAEETAYLARAWLLASENPLIGIYQSGPIFTETIFQWLNHLLRRRSNTMRERRNHAGLKQTTVLVIFKIFEQLCDS